MDREKGHEGNISTIPSEQVVVGDIIMVKIGDIIPADARVIPENLANLETDEALLTGESFPIAKVGDCLEGGEYSIGDRVNMVRTFSFKTRIIVR